MLARLGHGLSPFIRALRLLRRPALASEGGSVLVTETGFVLIKE